MVFISGCAEFESILVLPAALSTHLSPRKFHVQHICGSTRLSIIFKLVNCISFISVLMLLLIWG